MLQIYCKSFLTIIYIIYKNILKLSKKIQSNDEGFKFKRYYISLIKNNFITLLIKMIYLYFFNLIISLMNHLKSMINLKTSLNVFIINKCVISIKRIS